MTQSSFTHIQKVRMLFKLILKLHRGLPAELQVIGTKYARDEFKRHKTCPAKEATIFMNEWTNYAISLARQLRIKGSAETKVLGSELPPELLESLRDEQIVQLYELMQAAKAPKVEDGGQAS